MNQDPPKHSCLNQRRSTNTHNRQIDPSALLTLGFFPLVFPRKSSELIRYDSSAVSIHAVLWEHKRDHVDQSVVDSNLQFLEAAFKTAMLQLKAQLMMNSWRSVWGRRSRHSQGHTKVHGELCGGRGHTTQAYCRKTQLYRRHSIPPAVLHKAWAKSLGASIKDSGNEAQIRWPKKPTGPHLTQPPSLAACRSSHSQTSPTPALDRKDPVELRNEQHSRPACSFLQLPRQSCLSTKRFYSVSARKG